MINLRTDFEVCMFSRSIDKSRSLDLDHAPFDLLLHLLVSTRGDQSAHQISVSNCTLYRNVEGSLILK